MEPFYNERRFSYMAGEAEQGMAVGQFLKERGYSRHALTLLKQTEGGILCNGREVYLSQPLRKGDRMDLFLRVSVFQGRFQKGILPRLSVSMVPIDDNDSFIADPGNLKNLPDSGKVVRQDLRNRLFHQKVALKYHAGNRKLPK